MPKIKVKPEHFDQAEKIKEIIEKTRILKREFELEYGKWNFVVLGSDGNGGFVIREGFAQHMRIFSLPVYSATIGDPELIGMEGMPLEDFVCEDIPDEMRGMEVFQVDPIRPLTINKKWNINEECSFQKVVDDCQEGTSAVILTPDEKFWYMSVLKYLNECDDFFPDQFIQDFRGDSLPEKSNIIGLPNFDNKNMFN